MGIRNSYKAFVGLEFSIGKFCKTTACFSIDRKVQPVGKNKKVRPEHKEEIYSATGIKNESHITDAVYSVIDEQVSSKRSKLIDDVVDLSKKKLPKHIYQYLKTEQQFRYAKGQALDFFV